MEVISTVGEKLFHLVNAPFVKVAQATNHLPPCGTIQVNEGTLGFVIPNFGEMLTFLVKGFFVIAGLAALVMLLWGALAWVLSGGDKEKVEGARDRITAAIIGVFMILVALAIIWTLENIVFQKTICFGLSCPVSLPTLLKKTTGPTPPPDCLTPTAIPRP